MKKFEGHINIGKRITVYGDNAMHYAVNIWTKRFGYICIHPTVESWKWYFYLSPNATPWAATYAKGPGLRESDKHLAPIRKILFGHNFDTEKNRDALKELNNTYEKHYCIEEACIQTLRWFAKNRR